MVVMAPALTEPGQTQNLKLLPSPSSPASPTAAVRAVSDEIFFCDVARHLKSENILNGDSVCINGTKLKSGLANLKPSRPRIVIPAESCPPCLDEVLDCKGENGSFMMNSDSPSQDQSNNMGLQKSHPGMVPSLETGSFLKENFLPPEMDQLFKNLGAAINSNDIAPNMDELLQVFKSMESTVEDGTLEEAFSVAQEHVENVEADGMFPISDGADLTSALTNFDRDIFNDVEMNMCVDSEVHMPDTDVDTDAALQPAKECNTSERIEEARSKQFQSERRCEFLMRRLRKLQSKSMGRHASEEITGLMMETQRLMKETQAHAQPEEVRRERRPPRTIAQMLRQFEESSHAAANNRHLQHHYFGSGSRERISTVPSGPDAVDISAEVRTEVEKVAGQLHTQFHMIENAMDSDVTASSSGGESCDEMISYNNSHQQPLSIIKRAAWRWAQERAGVASRWTWLQAQISDLEYRIRQHTEIHRQIRLNKGEVKLGEVASQSSDPAQTPNGFHTSLDSVKEPPECMGATGTCRTRPFIRTNFRKRRLLNTAGLHLVSKKAARPSNIRCGCRSPLACCALCTGRSDPTYPREQPEQLTVQERIALLDPAYHPVLSFPSDVPQSIHLEALMRTPEWQQKMQRAAHKLSQRALERREREREREAFDELRNKKHVVVDHRKKYQRLKKPSHTLASIQKIKKKLTRGRKPKNHDAESLLRHKRKHKFRRNSSHPSHSGCDESGQDDLRVDVSGSGHPSPAPSPGDDRVHNFAMDRIETHRRKRENSYDIDNIVIPYSIASSTRVEKLQYKEILTPKWRVVDPDPTSDTKNNGGVRRSSHESDVEDVSDETILLRHERCEVEERKKFMAYVKNASAGRPRAHRRTDSRAGSSGANTPDPMSPITPAECLGEGMSPITSPPATPGAPTAEHDPCNSGIPASSISNQIARRSRTLSQSRFVREDYGRSATPDYDEVAPFEARVFPLSDEVYEKMLKVMPEGYPGPLYMCSNPSSVCDQNELTDAELPDNTDVLGESLPGTPSTDTDSAPGEEDPNDPEWTIGEKESAVKR